MKRTIIILATVVFALTVGAFAVLGFPKPSVRILVYLLVVTFILQMLMVIFWWRENGVGKEERKAGYLAIGFVLPLVWIGLGIWALSSAPHWLGYWAPIAIVLQLVQMRVIR